jgi:hypothetical protein
MYSSVKLSTGISTKWYLKSPLDLKPALSGSFGELRTAHFHSE